MCRNTSISNSIILVVFYDVLIWYCAIGAEKLMRIKKKCDINGYLEKILFRTVTRWREMQLRLDCEKSRFRYRKFWKIWRRWPKHHHNKKIAPRSSTVHHQRFAQNYWPTWVRIKLYPVQGRMWMWKLQCLDRMAFVTLEVKRVRISIVAWESSGNGVRCPFRKFATHEIIWKRNFLEKILLVFEWECG